MECVVFGAGSRYVYEVDETLCRLGWQIRAFVVNLPDGFRPDDLGPLVDVADLGSSLVGLAAVIPFTTPGHRQAARRHAEAAGFRAFPAVADPTTTFARSATIAQGAIVNAGGTVGANARVGRFALVNRSVSIGHDAVIGPYASLGPGCVLCGETVIGRGAFVGAGATVLPKVRIGDNAVIGAGSVVVHDVAGQTLVVGNPARVVKSILGHNGATVEPDHEGNCT